MPRFRQASFTGGEISSNLYGRVDLARYQSSLRMCKNFIVKEQGGVVNRPGTRFVAKAKSYCRLLPFVYNDTQSYVLELGSDYIRFHTQGAPLLFGPIVTAWNNSTIYLPGQYSWINGQIYACTKGNKNKNPETNPTLWTVYNTLNWDAGVTYRQGQFCWYGSKMWRCKQTALNQAPAETTYWTENWTMIYEISISLYGAALRKIDYTQSADILYLASTSFGILEVRRYGHTDWRVESHQVRRTASPPGWAGIQDKTTVGDVTHPGKKWTWVVTAVVETDRGREESVATSPFGNHTAALNPPTERRMVYNGDEQYLFNVAVFSDSPVVICWDAVANAIQYNVYRGQNGVYGFVGTCDADHKKYFNQSEWESWITGRFYYEGHRVLNQWGQVLQCITVGGGTSGATEPHYVGSSPISDGTLSWAYVAANYAGLVMPYFTDDISVPSYQDTPPEGTYPFNINNYPTAICFHEQRLIAGGLKIDPQVVVGSKTGNFNNYDSASPANDDDSFRFAVASRQVDGVRSLLSMRRLFVFTAGAEYAVDGGSGNPITPTAIDVKAQSYRGADWVRPVAIGNVALWIERNGAAVRELVYNYNDDGYSGNDVTALAKHLIEEFQIVEWSWARVPFQTMWCVREDGTLLGLTYMREHEISAWHWHVTGTNQDPYDVRKDAHFWSVCSLPEFGFDEDAVYFSVLRQSPKTGTQEYIIERMSQRRIVRSNVDVALYSYFVDSGLTYDGRRSSETFTFTETDPPTTWTAGAKIKITHHDVGGFAEVSVGDQIWIQYPAADGDWWRFDVLSIDATDFNYVWCTIPKDIPAGMRTATLSYGVAHRQFSGLSHLFETDTGKEVAVLADGHVHENVTVESGGIITLDRPAMIVHSGIPYVSRIETLNLAIQQQDIRPNKKATTKVSVEIDKSRGLWVGERTGELYPAKLRAPTDEYGLPDLVSDVVEVQIRSAWNTGGAIACEQRDPLPLTIMAIHPEVQIGD